MKFRLIVLFLTFIFYHSWLNAQKVLKSKSFYFLNDTTRIPDSMFTTTKFYGSDGKLYREEESHYKNSKLVRQYIGLFKDEFIITHLYENEKLIMKRLYDSLGSVVQDWGLTNNDKDTEVINYIPYYEAGKLVKMDNIFRGDTSTEYFQYKSYPDSSITIITEKSEYYSRKEKECINKAGKVIYKDTYTYLMGRIDERTITKNEYNDLGNIISITKSTNGKEEMRETYYYKFGKKSYSIKTKDKDKFFLKTFYD